LTATHMRRAILSLSYLIICILFIKFDKSTTCFRNFGLHASGGGGEWVAELLLSRSIGCPRHSLRVAAIYSEGIISLSSCSGLCRVAEQWPRQHSGTDSL
jgi:hypothetical protein